MRPLTKNPDNEQYFEYSPSSGFLPSVALGALLTTNFFLVITGRLRPLAKNGDNEQYAKYSPSSPFLPSVALGALLTRNLGVQPWQGGVLGNLGNLGRACAPL